MMKNMLMFIFSSLAITLFAQTVEVPVEVSGAIDDLVNNTVPSTLVLSGVIVTVVQVLKKILASFKLEVSGIKSQALAVLLAVAYASFNIDVWDDGVLSQKDVIVIIQSVISALGGIYGYKLLWRAPASAPKTKQPNP